MLKKYLDSIFPFLVWLREYNIGKLKLDLLAGITVGLVVVPQSMAYAQLAGLPTYFGLYAAFLPTIIAALFGSSYHLSTGPTAVVSLMTAVALEPIATAGSEAYLTYAILLSVAVGIFRLSIGLFRLGSIINFLSLPVVNGYTSAAAIIIATSQLSRIFGVYVNEEEYHFQTVYNVIKEAVNYTHFPTLILSIAALILMYLLKKYRPKIPYVLVAVTLATIFSWFFDYEYNINAKIDDIKVEEIKPMVNKFNLDMQLLTVQGSERSAILDKISRLKSLDSNAARVLKNEYYSALLGLKINNEKHETHILRDDLNNFKFEVVVEPDNIFTFYKLGAVPEGLKTDGRIWRIKVRNSPIDLNKIIMTGGGAVVGSIPYGFPGFKIPVFDWGIFLRFLPFAAIISLLGFMETISIAKSIAVNTKQRIDPNQELIGQGLANIIGAFAYSYPVSGSFSRSAVNYNSGGQTAISGVVTSLIVLASLYVLTPVLYFLPKAVLAAVIMIAVMSLVNIKGFIKAWKIHWYDGAIAFITFISTLILAPHLEYGILIGVVLSLIAYLYNSMSPRIVTLSMASDFALRSSHRYNLKECGYITAVRFDRALFFANSTYLEDYVLKEMTKKKELEEILIVCNGINDIDITGIEALKLLIEKVRGFKIGISFCSFNEKVMHILESEGVLDLIGHDRLYPTQADAIEDLFHKTHRSSVTDILACPLLSYIPKDDNVHFEDVLKKS